MGVTVRKPKGQSKWYVFVNHKKDRWSKCIGSKTSANAFAKEVEKQLAMNEVGFLGSEVPTVAEFGEKSIEARTRELASNSRTNYQHLFRNHIQSHAIGALSLDQMKPHHCKDFIADLKRKKLAKGTIKFIVVVLHGIFEDAREYDYVAANPCSRSGKWIKGRKKAQKGIKPLELSEAYTAQEAVEVIELSKSLEFQFHACIVLLIRSGMRPGEALGLSWRDIDFENRTVTVKHNWSYTHKELGPTKTGKERMVDLTPHTVEVLEQLREQSKFYRPVDPVFCNSEGQRLSDEKVRNQYYKVRLREAVKLRNLRHTYATIRIANGHNIVDVSKQIGHEDISMTLRVYALWVPSEHKHEVDELDHLHVTHAIRTQEPGKSVTTH